MTCKGCDWNGYTHAHNNAEDGPTETCCAHTCIDGGRRFFDPLCAQRFIDPDWCDPEPEYLTRLRARYIGSGTVDWEVIARHG